MLGSERARSAPRALRDVSGVWGGSRPRGRVNIPPRSSFAGGNRKSYYKRLKPGRRGRHLHSWGEELRSGLGQRLRSAKSGRGRGVEAPQVGCGLEQRPPRSSSLLFRASPLGHHGGPKLEQSASEAPVSLPASPHDSPVGPAAHCGPSTSLQRPGLGLSLLPPACGPAGQAREASRGNYLLARVIRPGPGWH